MLFNENKGTEMWAQMLTENFGVTDASKKAWVAEYASVHEVYESALGLGGAASAAAPVPSNGVSPLYATPLIVSKHIITSK
jgi:hypothetical protein